VATCLYSKSETEHLLVAGFRTAEKLKPKKFSEIVFPLKLLFGFFSDYKDRVARWATVTFR
jgi:hypothetical protein